MSACPRCTVCSHHHFPTDPCIFVGVKRPDAAPPEEGDVKITEDICGNRWATGVVGKQPPPSDAAPVITDEDLRSIWDAQFNVDIGGPQKEAIRAAIAAVVARHLALYAHPKDAPPEVTEEMIRAALDVETAEGGPVGQDIGFGMMRSMLCAALAAQKEGK